MASPDESAPRGSSVAAAAAAGTTTGGEDSVASMPFSEEYQRNRSVRNAARAMGLGGGGGVGGRGLHSAAGDSRRHLLELRGDMHPAAQGEAGPADTTDSVNESAFEPLGFTDRLAGVVFGTCVGDILGANLEFMSSEKIARTFGYVRDFKHSTSRPLGMFTDDTEMTGALVSSIVHCSGAVDAVECAREYVRAFRSPPRRGYGPSVSALLQRLADYEDKETPREAVTLDEDVLRSLATAEYPVGSYGNGCLMRISVLGVFFREDSESDLRAAVEAALLCTHVHPEAVEASFTCALIAQALSTQPHGFGSKAESQIQSSTRPGLRALLRSLADRATVPAVRASLDCALQSDADDLDDEAALDLLVQDTTFGRHFAIRASEALGVVCWGLLRQGHEPELCLIRAVNWGGDADTIGAILGALLGAWHGTRWIPARWWKRIEDSEESELGFSRLLELSKELATLTSSVKSITNTKDAQT